MKITKEKLARLKLYLDKGKNHFGTLQMPMTIVIMLGVFKDTDFGRFIFQYSYIAIPLIIIFFFLLLILVGRFEYTKGFIEKQFQVDNEKNGLLNEILKTQKEILHKLEK